MGHHPGESTVSYHTAAKVRADSHACFTNYREKLDHQADYWNSEVTAFLELLLGPLQGPLQLAVLECCLFCHVPPDRVPPLLLTSVNHRAGNPISPAVAQEDVVLELPVINGHIVWNFWQSPLGKVLKWRGANWYQQLLAFWGIITCSLMDTGRD